MTKTKQVQAVMVTTLALLAYPASAMAQGATPAPAPAPAAPAPAAAAPAAAPAPAAPAAGSAAANPNCPPGSWFCADAPAQGGAPPAQAGKPLEPLPGQAGQTPAAPPVVVYQPAAPPVVVVQGKEAPPPAAYPYKPRPAPRRSEWGLNLHAEGAFLGKGYNGNAGMLGAGLGLRFRPAPVAAIEADLDFAGGRDYNGYRRGESAFTVNCLLFANPKDKAQVYFLGGFGWAAAHAVDDTGQYANYDRTFNYGYFGAQGGVGMEFRLGRHFALNFDGRLFVRGRTDSDARYNPEFRDGNGKTSNTSGGALLTGGATFYF